MKAYFIRYVTILLFPCILLISACNKNGDDFIRDSRGVTSFSHPGILNSQSSLDFIRTDASIAGSWRAEIFESTVEGFIGRYTNDISTVYPATVYVKASGSTVTENKMRTDAQLAYALALKWAKNSDSTVAKQAITILNGWAYNFEKLDTVKGTNGAQRYLEAAWVIPTFAAAAEIIRWYKVDDTESLWQPADVKQFELFLRRLMTEYSDNTFNSQYLNNWYVSAAYAKMCVGVFLSDYSVYNKGYDLLKGIMPRIIQPDGTLPEYCSRADCRHFQYSLTGFTLGAEIDKIQSGSNEMYDLLGSRLSKGFEFMRMAYAGSVSGCNYCDLTKEVYPGVAVAYRHYANQTLGYLTTLKQPAFGVTGDKTFLGFTMYTHYNVP